MDERRNHPRLLCADLVKIRWRSASGDLEEETANLEDISLNGICVQLDTPIASGVQVQIQHEKGDFRGYVRYCAYRDIGYFLGIELDPSTRWSPKAFKPLHLLDPRRLVQRAIERAEARTA